MGQISDTAHTITPTTRELSLEKVLDKLRLDSRILAVVTLGSTGSRTRTSISDYDIMVILNHHKPGFTIEFSMIDRTMADVLFYDKSWIEHLLGPEKNLTAGERELAYRLHVGTIEFDHSELVARAKERSAEIGYTDTAYDAEWCWIWINYQLRLHARFMQSKEEAYHFSLQIKSHEIIVQIFRAWFTVRGLPWEGEKKSFRRLQKEDPKFLKIVQDCMAETDTIHKLELARKAGIRAIDPVGGVWPDGQVARGKSVWESLFSVSK